MLKLPLNLKCIMKCINHTKNQLQRGVSSARLGHIDFECPNQNVIVLIKKDEAKENVEEVVEFNHVQEDEKSAKLFVKSSIY